MRKQVIAGNWKMNKDVAEAAALVNELTKTLAGTSSKATVVVCPPFVSLTTVADCVKGTAVKLGAQNMSDQDDGAFTGETSSRMLLSAGCEYVILGHSERRQYYGETDAWINKKVKKALGAGLKPIVCVGETLQEREGNITDEVVTRQVKGVLDGLTAEQMSAVIIAYEPVWAIGTGKTATPEQANQVHKLIRDLVAKLYTQSVADALVIQYGGSVNAANAQTLLSQSDIDGALVGGASLKADQFTAIILAAR